jgi:glyoxylate/succinic semialdehyde reductase
MHASFCPSPSSHILRNPSINRINSFKAKRTNINKKKSSSSSSSSSSRSRFTPRAASSDKMANTQQKTIGFLGAGIMAVPMALNLINNGNHNLIVWNRTASACDPLVKAGATLAKTAQEVCEKADVTYVMVSTPEATLEVANLAKDGISNNKGYVDCSTVDRHTAKKVSDIITSKGGRYLEGPVSGSKAPAENGQLIFLCAGSESLFKEINADDANQLNKMGKASFFLGEEVGAGANMKLIVNSCMGSIMASFAESIALCEDANLSKQDLLDVLALGAINVPMFGMKGPGMIASDKDTKFAPAFPLKHQQKDMRLAVQLADELGRELPVAATANEMYKRARRDGHDDEDFAAVLHAVRRER